MFALLPIAVCCSSVSQYDKNELQWSCILHYTVVIKMVCKVRCGVMWCDVIWWRRLVRNFYLSIYLSVLPPHTVQQCSSLMHCNSPHHTRTVHWFGIGAGPVTHSAVQYSAICIDCLIPLSLIWSALFCSLLASPLLLSRCAAEICKMLLHSRHPSSPAPLNPT